MLSGAREAGCFREVAALHSDHLRQVPLYNIVNLIMANPQNEKVKTCTLKVHAYHSHILGICCIITTF